MAPPTDNKRTVRLKQIRRIALMKGIPILRRSFCQLGRAAADRQIASAEVDRACESSTFSDQRRKQAIDKAQAALERGEREHDKRVATIEAERDALEKKSQAENAHWSKEREKLESAMRRARD